MTAADIVSQKKYIDLITVDKLQSIEEALRIILEHNYSQLPVTSGNRIIGSVSEAHVFNHVLNDPESKSRPVETIMQEAFAFADITTPFEELSKMVSDSRPAVMVKDFKANRNYIITRFDIAAVIAK
jgi:cystathionine beta-synthase